MDRDHSISDQPDPTGVSASQLVIKPANLGDHGLIHSLLRTVLQTPSADQFASWLDEPSYVPSDRILGLFAGQIVSHLHLLDRQAWFEGEKVHISGLQHLAVLAEFCKAGFGQKMLRAAEKTMRSNRAILGMIRTDQVAFFQKNGWSTVQHQGYTEASSRDILSHLETQQALSRQQKPKRNTIQIRRWHPFGIHSLSAVYRRSQQASGWGVWYRNDTYWQWLLGRNQQDHILVAVRNADSGLQSFQKLGPQKPNDTNEEIIAYAVLRKSHIIELVYQPGAIKSAIYLLGRVCQDAIERDYHTITLHNSVNDDLHEHMITAGGQWCANDSALGGALMIKLMDARRWCEKMENVLLKRTRRAGFSLPLQWHFQINNNILRLSISRRDTRLTLISENIQPDFVCNESLFSNLLLGNLEPRLISKEEIHACGKVSLKELFKIFPARQAWQSVFDLF